MVKGLSWYKRTIMLCAFLLCACSQQDTSVDADSDPKQSQSTVDINKTPAPLATLQELLGAYDVQNALAQAVANNDEQSIAMWQEALLSAADEVYLAPQERALISGSQGIQFLTFQGMKINYQIAFERAFVEFEDVNQVYADYPAFENLHKSSMALVKQRDELVAKVYEQLLADGYGEDALTEARRQWQNFFLSQQSLERASR